MRFKLALLIAATFILISQVPTVASADHLEGPSDEPANAHIPDIPFPAPDSADFSVFEDVFALSFREIFLVFENTTTVEQANQLLHGIDATLIGGAPPARLLLIKVPLSDMNEMMTLLTSLNANPLVETAISEMGGTLNGLPPHDVVPPDWTWEVPTSTGDARSGNWGLKRIRAPQMWNLDTLARRNRSSNPLSAGILDDGFNPTHPALTKLQIAGPNTIKVHGTMVAGIVGADWGSQGIAGINPWLQAIRARELAPIGLMGPIDLMGRRIDQILSLLLNERSIRAINVSYGISYRKITPPGAPAINPKTTAFGDFNSDGDHVDTHGTMQEFGPVDLDGNGIDTWSDWMNYWGRFYGILIAVFTEGVLGIGREDFALVAAAGNDGAAFRAEDTNAISNAATRFGEPFVSVGAIDRQNNPWSDAAGATNGGASVYAPGAAVRSTALGSGFAVDSGTSYAAPFVTGLITALWQLDPGLEPGEIKTLITDPSHTTTAGSDLAVVDAFAAAIGIDLIQGGEDIQKALVDVDDGSIDGNLRVDPGTGDVVELIFTPDGLRGDGTIDMKDFRAFRDAMLQVRVEQQELNPDQVALDGNPAHFKKDLNFDACAATILGGATIAAPAFPPHPGGVPVPDTCAPVAENIFPRYDFNGSGRVDSEGRLLAPGSDGVAPFKIDPDSPCPGLGGGCLRDIDVLASSGWTADAQGVSVDSADEGVVEDVLGRWRPKRDLLADRDQDGEMDYLRSADLHFTFPPGNPDRVHEFEVFVASELPQGIDVANGNCPGVDELPFGFRQCVKIPAPGSGDDETRLIITVPVWTGKVMINISIIADPPFFAGTRKSIEAKMGEDFYVQFGPVEEPQPSVSAKWEGLESFISTEGDPPARFGFHGVFLVEEAAGATEVEFSVRCHFGCDDQSSMDLAVLPIQARMEFDLLLPEILVPKPCQTHHFTFTAGMPGTVGSARLLLGSHTPACP